MMFATYTSLFSLLFVINLTQAEVLKAECPFPSPCECRTVGVLKVFCQYESLTEIPEITQSENNGTWIVDLSGNRVKTIPAAAFKNIKMNSLWLSYNDISYVDKNAFLGSEDTLESLYINGNRLPVLPTAVGSLTTLSELQIQYNPIKELDETILINISETLQALSFGSYAMSLWPASLKYLSNIFTLNIYGFPEIEIPNDAFQNFEDTLQSFKVDSTNISKFPDSLNSLENLSTITFSNNKKLKYLPEELFRGLNKIHTVLLQENALQNMSAIFRDSASMLSFTLHSDTITDITESLYSVNSQPQFSTLSLFLKKMNYVPKVVSNIPSLSDIEMYRSNISIILSTDFLNLPSLSILELVENPITMIEKNAFLTSPSLNSLNLQNTNLTTVPEAIKNLKEYSTINLSGAPVVCTCASLAWMREWKTRNATNINGQCVNLKIPISEFQMNYIPKC